ncbi:MAG: ATP-binding cassette domain-containing protein [Anaerolineaceae bacterium]|nr:ATP-binding cassette domain-containing protein [Anaerolineaceae bacterium]
MQSNASISVDRVVKNYGDFRAVDNLSFDVHSGEVFAILGPNGSGKTTTIRMILDILKPDSGQISVLGGAINDQTKDRIGYLPEERGLYRSVKVLEMMVYLGMLKGMSRRDARRRSLELLEQLELSENSKSKVSELSKGMQQKVQFAVTVMHNPALIIVDELFSGLDPVNTRVVKDLLLKFRQDGGTVVMSTHQMWQVEEIADRLLMIDKGARKLYGRVDDIRKQYALHAIVVEGQGDWASLPGVDHIEHNGREGTTLYLTPEATSSSVLAAITTADNMTIERFELAVPSLNEIFIKVVEEQ